MSFVNTFTFCALFSALFLALLLCLYKTSELFFLNWVNSIEIYLCFRICQKLFGYISRYVCMAREPTPMLNMLRIRGVRQDGMNGGEKWLQQRLQP